MRYCRCPSGRLDPNTFEITPACHGSGINDFPAHSPLVCFKDRKTSTARWAAWSSNQNPVGGLREERLFLFVANIRHLDLRTIDGGHPELTEVRREQGVVRRLCRTIANRHPEVAGRLHQRSIGLSQPGRPRRNLQPPCLMRFVQMLRRVPQGFPLRWLSVPFLPALGMILERPAHLQHLRRRPWTRHNATPTLRLQFWRCVRS